MTREEQDEQIWLYAAGALDGAEADAVRKLLAEGDPADAAAYAEAMTTISHLPLALDALEPPKSARDRLLSRVAASQSAGGRGSWFAWTLTGIAAAAVLFLTVRVNQLTDQLNEAARKSAAMEMVSLTPGETQPPKAHGRVYWDRQANEWHVMVFDLTPPPPGMVLELWMIPPGKAPVPAGTFMVDAKGNGSIMTKVPANLELLTMAAITDEPGPNGMPAPTGKIQLSGKAD